jgi:hypothetical protein
MSLHGCGWNGAKRSESGGGRDWRLDEFQSTRTNIFEHLPSTDVKLVSLVVGDLS